jgi:Ca-activated chloride channel family protein
MGARPQTGKRHIGSVGMSVESPLRLLALVIPIALGAWYLWSRTHRARQIVVFSSLDLADRVAPANAGWRRWATAVAGISGALVLAVAFARPVIAIPIPQEQASLILAVDVSLSMGAADVDPSRIDAAQRAASDFAEIAPNDLNIGLVAFAGTALPVLAPDTDRAPLNTAIERLGLGQGTAIGEAIFSSLEQLEAVVPDPQVPKAIVVLSDGETTVGRPDTEAAAAAVEAGVPVYTISFGTSSGIVDYQGERIRVPVAPGPLRQIAEATGGQFFETASESDLSAILSEIGSEIAFETEDREVTDWFAVAGLALVSLGIAGSIRWFGRIA